MTKGPPPANAAPPGNAAGPRRLVVTIHGIRTYADWQLRLKRLVERDDSTADVRMWRYGYFSVFAFLLPFLRWIQVFRFRRYLLAAVDERSWDRIDIVAHSFGTYVAAWALRFIHRKRGVRIHTLLLAGSVLKEHFDWIPLVSRRGVEPRVERVVNECGSRDVVLWTSKLVVLGCGMAGWAGFAFAESDRFRSRRFGFGHSGYFASTSGAPGNDFMKRWWVPLLRGTGAIPSSPMSRNRGALRGPLETFLRTFDLSKTAAYVTVTLLVVGAWRETSSARSLSEFEALAARATQLGAEGRPMEGLRRVVNALRGTPDSSVPPPAADAISRLLSLVPTKLEIPGDGENPWRRVSVRAGDGAVALVAAAGVAEVRTGPALADRRRFGDPPPSAMGVVDAVWSPDGTRLAALSRDGTVRILDGATLTVLRTIAPEPRTLYSPGARVVWNPRRDELAVCFAGGVFTAGAPGWKATLRGRGEPVAPGGPVAAPMTCGFSSDGTKFAILYADGTTEVHPRPDGGAPRRIAGDLARGRLMTLAGGDSGLVRFDEEARRVVVGGRGMSTRILDLADGSARTLDVGTDWATGAEFIDLGPASRPRQPRKASLVVTRFSGGISRFDLSDGSPRASPAIALGQDPRLLAVPGTSHVVAIARRGEIHVLRGEDGAILGTTLLAGAGILNAEFDSSPNTLVVCGADGSLRRLSFADAQPDVRLRVRGAELTSFELSANGKVAVGTSREDEIFWLGDDGRVLTRRSLRPDRSDDVDHPAIPRVLWTDRDGDRAFVFTSFHQIYDVSRSAGTATPADVETGDDDDTAPEIVELGPARLAFLSTGRSSSSSVTVLDLRTRALSYLHAPDHTAIDGVIGPNCSNDLILWGDEIPVVAVPATALVPARRPDTPEALPPPFRLEGDASVSALAVSPDCGIVAIGTRDGRLRLFRHGALQAYAALEGSKSAHVQPSEVRPDAGWVAPGVQTSEVTHIAWLSPTKFVSAGVDGTVRCHDARAGATLWVTPAHNGAVTVLRVAAGASGVISAGRDGLVRVLDPTDGKPTRTIRASHGPIMIARPGADALTLFVLTSDGEIARFDLQVASLRARAESLIRALDANVGPPSGDGER